MKVIFLDFDGVLNSHAFMRSDPVDGAHLRESAALDPAAVLRLNRLVAETGAAVVVSSSWRYGRSVDRLRGILEERGFVGQVLDKTADWSRKEMNGLYVAQERGDEIRKWLDEHPEVTSFVVLDDDSDMTAVRDHHVKTSLFNGGLLDEHVDRAAAILRDHMCSCAAGCRSREEMRRRHGTPEEFAEAVRRAVGEISLDEASAAIARYEAEYGAAKEAP